jgi:hypothetical protein
MTAAMMPMVQRGAHIDLLARMRAQTAAILDADRRAQAARCPGVSAVTERRIAVTGAVRRPAVFLWDEGVTCADAIAIAGGPRSGPVRAVIVRRLDQGTVEIPVCLETRGVTASVPLRPADELRLVLAE